MSSALQELGYHIVDEVFSSEEIGRMREISYNYFLNDGGFRDSTGRAKPDWIKDESLLELKEIIDSKNLEDVIENIIGEQVSFVGHNDLHINRSVGWHKDRLNGEARKYEINNPWSVVGQEKMKIYKVNIYLQSHATGSDGLIVKKGSHLSESMSTGEQVTLNPSLGSIVLFDQRITHRAQWSGGYNRMLICMGYGVRNCFFDEFKKGTEFRQNKQNTTIIKREI